MINPSVEIELGNTKRLSDLRSLGLGRSFLLEHGIVKSFDESEGFGWILAEEGTSDLFFRQRSIVSDDRTMTIGARVTYESRFVEGEGLEAVNVSLSK
jgi:cold shock CspA family protein